MSSPNPLIIADDSFQGMSTLNPKAPAFNVPSSGVSGPSSARSKSPHRIRLAKRKVTLLNLIHPEDEPLLKLDFSSQKPFAKKAIIFSKDAPTKLGDNDRAIPLPVVKDVSSLSVFIVLLTADCFYRCQSLHRPTCFSSKQTCFVRR